MVHSTSHSVRLRDSKVRRALTLSHQLAQQPLAVPIRSIQQSRRLLQRGASFAELAANIENDPALSAQLLKHVNQQRQRYERPAIGALEACLNLLGERAIEVFLQKLPVLEQQHIEAEQLLCYLTLYDRCRHAAFQAREWAYDRGDSSPKELALAVSLQFIGELSLCLYEFPILQSIYTTVIQRGYSIAAAGVEVLGCRFPEFTGTIAEHWQFPELARDAMRVDRYHLYRVQGVLLAAELATQVELRGWYHAQTVEVIHAAAGYLQVEFAHAASLLHQRAATAARRLPRGAGVVPAARLLEPSISEQVEKPQIDSKRYRAVIDYLDSVAQGVKIRQVIDPLLDGLITAVGLQRAMVVTTNTNGMYLLPKYSAGDMQNWLQFEAGLSGKNLFRLLLKKPQILKLDPKNIAQYDLFIPAAVKQSLASDNFMVCAMHLGRRPIGLLLADAGGAAIDDTQFRLSKSLWRHACAALNRACGMQVVQRPGAG